MPEPVPTLCPYSTIYPVKTGRSRKVGFIFELTGYLYVSETEIASGWAEGGTDYFGVAWRPVFSWACASGGWHEGYWDEEIQDYRWDFDPEHTRYQWHNWYDDYCPPSWIVKPASLFYMTDIVSWVEDGQLKVGYYASHHIGVQDYDISNNGKLYAYPENYARSAFTCYVRSEAETDEYVKIEENAGYEAWDYPYRDDLGYRREGMKTIKATYQDIAKTSLERVWVGTGSYLINAPYTYTQADSIGISAGTGSGFPGVIDYRVTFDGQIGYPPQYTNSPIRFENPVLWAEAKCGTSEVDMLFPEGKYYQITYPNAETEEEEIIFRAEEDTISCRACQTHQNLYDESSYCKAVWEYQTVAYRFDGEVRRADGSELAAEPKFEDRSYSDDPDFEPPEDRTFTGLPSPIFRYSGHWTFEGYSGFYYLTGAPVLDTNDSNEKLETTDLSFELNDPPPKEFSVHLINAGELHGEPDDFRILLQYPRERSAVILDLSASVILDDLSEGWQAENCILTYQQTGFEVTNISSGARIYKTFTAKHFPPYRFVEVRCTVTNQSTGEPLNFTATLKLGSREYSHIIKDTTIYDICCPTISKETPDTSQSYFELARPESEEELAIPDEAWSWGVGLFDCIEFSNLTEGAKYQFTGLTAKLITEDKDGDPISAYHIEVSPQEGTPWFPTNEEQAEVRLGVERAIVGISNGRIGYECPAVRTYDSLYVKEHYNVPLAELIDKSRIYPHDDYNALSISSSLPEFDSDWYSEGEPPIGDEVWLSEDLLFCKEYAPVYFLSPYEANAWGQALPRDPRDKEIFYRPVYDVIVCNNHFGDGSERNSRDGYLTFRFAKLIESRVHGLIYDGERIAQEAKPSTKSFPIIAQSYWQEPFGTDALSYFRSSHHNSPVTVSSLGIQSEIEDIDVRKWYRIAIALPLEVGGACISAYQEPLNNAEHVFLVTDEGHLYVYIVDNPDERPLTYSRKKLAEGAFSCSAVLLPNGRARVYYTTEDGSAYYIESSADWADELEPKEITPPSSAKAIYHAQGLAIPSAVPAEDDSEKLGGEVYLLAVLHDNGEDAEIHSCPQGATAIFGEFEPWRPHNPQVDSSAISAGNYTTAREESGLIRYFYRTSSGGSAGEIRCASAYCIKRSESILAGGFDGDGANYGAEQNESNVIIANTQESCPTAVYAPFGGYYYLITWEDGKFYIRRIRFSSADPGNYECDISDRVEIDGSVVECTSDIPSGNVPEQRPGFYIDRMGRLRLIWFESNDIKMCTVRRI